MKQIEPQQKYRIGTVSNIELLVGVCGLKPVLRDPMISRAETSLLTKDVCQVHIVGRYIAAWLINGVYDDTITFNCNAS